MKLQYEVCTIESERGWGQKREYEYFDSVEAAIKYRDQINSHNKPLENGEIAPDWYMIAEQEIRVREV